MKVEKWTFWRLLLATSIFILIVYAVIATSVITRNIYIRDLKFELYTFLVVALCASLLTVLIVLLKKGKDAKFLLRAGLAVFILFVLAYYMLVKPFMLLQFAKQPGEYRTYLTHYKVAHGGRGINNCSGVDIEETLLNREVRVCHMYMPGEKEFGVASVTRFSNPWVVKIILVEPPKLNNTQAGLY